MIDTEKKRARERRGSSEYRKRSRARGLPPSHRIDRAIAAVLLADILRPTDGSVDSWQRAELERAVAKKCGTTEAAEDQKGHAKEAIRRRINFLLNAATSTSPFDDFGAIGSAGHEE